ncbi:MAG: phage integrase N-terminal SAM-like domain-containing protein [Candidatus Brocadiaceae bacterium]|nr:phage integrase N-terminal SAM-like domain-containing protein [Candidatus Brocadiaceae bacterium]
MFYYHSVLREKVSVSTQNQALSALPFLYRHVLDRKVGDLGKVIRARKPKCLPVVMTRDEVTAVLAQLTGDKWLMASLMYEMEQEDFMLIRIRRHNKKCKET